MNSLGLVLEQYPDDVIVYITDPRTGVQRKHKWPPMISEIVEACDNRVAEMARTERYQNWGVGNPAQIEGPREERPTAADLKAKYGDNWGLTEASDGIVAATDRPVPTWDSIATTYAADPSRIAALVGRKGEASNA